MEKLTELTKKLKSLGHVHSNRFELHSNIISLLCTKSAIAIRKEWCNENKSLSGASVNSFVFDNSANFTIGFLISLK